MASIEFDCDSCGKAMRVPGNLAGKRGRCPSCEHLVRIPLVSAPAAAAASAGSKTCPYCAEEIKLAARKCRHCGEFLDGESRGPRLSWRNNMLVVPHGVRIPSDSCSVCGAEHGVTVQEKKFSYHPPWIYIGLLGGLLPALLLALVTTKHARIQLPICRPCASRGSKFNVALILFGVVGLMAFPMIFSLLGSLIAGKRGSGGGALLGFFSWLIALFVLVVMQGRYKVMAGPIDHSVAHLKFPDPAVSRRLSGQGSAPRRPRRRR